jgi:Flp pilus assembly protein TadB
MQYVIPVLLFAANIFFVYTIFRFYPVRYKLKTTLHFISDAYIAKKSLNQLRKHNRSELAKVSLMDRLELRYIERSNINRYLTFMNIYTLLLFSVCLFVISFSYIYKLINFVPTGLIISVLLSLLPFFALDILARYNSETIRKRLAEFVSILNRWCKVKEDIFYAFEKSIDSGIDEPLRTYIRDMLVQVNRGIDPSEALDLLQMKVDNSQFRDLILNLNQNVKHRGDINILLSNMEEQFYRMEEEYNRRKISTYKDRLIILFVMISVLVIAALFIESNATVKDFYLYDTQGKALLALFALLYAFGFYLSLGIGRFKY